MNATGWIIGSVVLAAAGQLLIKRGVNRTKPIDLSPGTPASRLVWFLVERHFILALSLYGLSTWFWLIALRMVDLSYAFPFVSLSLIVTTLGARVFYGEVISRRVLIGVSLISAGVLLVSLS